MGTWGSGIYDNDDAADWSHEVTERGLGAVEAALDAVLEAEYVEAPEGACAVVAADVLARLISGRGEESSYAGAVVAWVASTVERPTAPLIAKAKQALERLRGEESELAELWADDESSYASWLQTLKDVEQRLG